MSVIAAHKTSENAPAAAMTVEPLTQQHVEILRLADTPQLSNGFDLTIAPSTGCGSPTGAREYTWNANISGYRVLANGVVDMDATSISLWNDDRDITPHWLMGLIEKYAPSSW